MMQLHTSRTNHTIKLMERSVYSARYCFIEKMSREGFIPPPSATVIDEHFDWILNNTDVNVDLISMKILNQIIYSLVLFVI